MKAFKKRGALTHFQILSEISKQDPHLKQKDLAKKLGITIQAVSENIKVNNPAANISIPKVSADISENIITINQTPISIEKINFILSGKIKDYLTVVKCVFHIHKAHIKTVLRYLLLTYFYCFFL